MDGNPFIAIMNEMKNKDVHGEECYEVTQTLRREIVDKLLSDASVLSDAKMLKVLTSTLNNMDKQIIDRKRLDSDSMSAGSNQLIQDIVAAMHAKNPNGLKVSLNLESAAPPAPPELPEFDLSEGELTKGLIDDNSKDFISRMKDEGIA